MGKDGWAMGFEQGNLGSIADERGREKTKVNVTFPSEQTPDGHPHP